MALFNKIQNEQVKNKFVERHATKWKVLNRSRTVVVEIGAKEIF